MKFYSKTTQAPALWTPRISSIFSTACALLVTCAIALPLASTPADARKRSKKKTETVIVKPKGPLTIVISLGRQRVTVFDGTRAIANSPISSGSAGRRTPKGIYTIIQKHRRHFSNLYGSAPMPNMQRITWDGIAMHAGNLPGYPASHGCIRLPWSFSKRLFGITNMGTRVIVTQSQPRPRQITHRNLFKPLPAGDQSFPPRSTEATNRRPTSTSTASLLLGVTPAHAETQPFAAPMTKPTGSALTRASLARFREQEIGQLEQSVSELIVERKRTALVLKAANAQVRQASQSLAKAKAASDQLSQTITNTTRATYKASARMQVFIKDSYALDGSQELSTAAQREDALEAEFLEHETEREMARNESTELAALVAARSATLNEKQDRRKKALRAAAIASKSHSTVLRALNYAKQALKNRGTPITILISRKTMKLHVRQGYEPMFDAPIQILQPDAPLGTHFYAAYGYSQDGNDLVWNALTAARQDIRIKRTKRSRRSRRRRREPDQQVVVATPGMPAQTAENALNRIVISADVRARLAELMVPDTAIIISDRGASNKTGKFTSIIVDIR